MSASARSNKPQALKPQDVVVALKLALRRNHPWSYQEIAKELELSSSTVHQAVERLTIARLFNGVRKRVVSQALLDFIEHGVRYAFPAHPAERIFGMPTAASAPPLVSRLLTGDDARVVWPAREEGTEGYRIVPLYPKVPKAARRDPALYELLALVDAFRIGTSRERELAHVELRKRLA